MKETLLQLTANIPCIACVTIAGILALKGKDGWGWFLMAALFLFATISIKK